MDMDPEKGFKGPYFDDFLKDEGLLGEVSAGAVKQVIAWQLRQAMDDLGLSKVEMARRVGTSRAQLDRLLDPENDGVSLAVLARAAHAVGRSLKIELV